MTLTIERWDSSLIMINNYSLRTVYDREILLSTHDAPWQVISAYIILCIGLRKVIMGQDLVLMYTVMCVLVV